MAELSAQLVEIHADNVRLLEQYDRSRLSYVQANLRLLPLNLAFTVFVLLYHFQAGVR